MNKREKAESLFKEGYNCAQSVILAFSDELPLDEDTLAKLASSFGAGMGRLREVCGAVSSIFMIEGLLNGYISPNDDKAKAEHYRHIQELAEAFKEKNQTIICRELLGLKDGPSDYIPCKRTENYYAERPCTKFVGDAAEIIEKMILK